MFFSLPEFARTNEKLKGEFQDELYDDIRDLHACYVRRCQPYRYKDERG
jgi:hypothetical protein